MMEHTGDQLSHGSGALVAAGEAKGKVRMEASREEDRWVKQFLARHRQTRLREHILAEAWRDEGRIERRSAPEHGLEWIRVNGEDIGGPADRDRACAGIEAIEALECERPQLVRRESPSTYRLTPAGRSVARVRRRESR